MGKQTEIKQGKEEEAQADRTLLEKGRGEGQKEKGRSKDIVVQEDSQEDEKPFERERGREGKGGKQIWKVCFVLSLLQARQEFLPARISHHQHRGRKK